jgi:hypothetical protein
VHLPAAERRPGLDRDVHPGGRTVVHQVQEARDQTEQFSNATGFKINNDEC